MHNLSASQWLEVLSVLQFATHLSCLVKNQPLNASSAALNILQASVMSDMPTATTTRSEIMLEGLIDYAGLYPPASLDMQTTVNNWSMNLASEDKWMLARLIIPVNRLDEFIEAGGRLLPKPDQEPWQLSVLLPEASSNSFAEEAQHVVDFNMSSCGAIANVVEFKATSTAEIDAALSCLHDDLFPFIELRIDQDPRGLVAALAGRLPGSGGTFRSALTRARGPARRGAAG